MRIVALTLPTVANNLATDATCSPAEYCGPRHQESRRHWQLQLRIIHTCELHTLSSARALTESALSTMVCVFVCNDDAYTIAPRQLAPNWSSVGAMAAPHTDRPGRRRLDSTALSPAASMHENGVWWCATAPHCRRHRLALQARRRVRARFRLGPTRAAAAALMTVVS